MKCVSLFSGCGGLDYGLKRAGFATVFGNDNSPECAASFQANLPGTGFYLGSVSDVTFDLMRTISGKKVAKGIDLLAGGPPCPPYSKSRFYRKSKPRALEDAVGQETLEGYLNVLRVLEPRAFLLENVHGLAYKVHREALDLILKTASKLGFLCAWKVQIGRAHV